MVSSALSDEVYTVSEAAKLLKISERTIQRWCRTGRLDALRLPGERVIRIPGRELRRILGRAGGGTEKEATWSN